MSSTYNTTSIVYANLAPGYQLNYLEKLWASWYSWMGNDLLATGFLLLISHELVYFGRSLPWAIIDFMPVFNKYKIQDTKHPSPEEYWRCLKEVLIAHTFIEAVPIFAFHTVCTFFNIDVGVPFPSWQKVCLQVALFFVMEDTWHYWGHRLLHHKLLYKRFHKQHHKYAAPFGLTAEYAHPVEVAFTGTGTVGSPILYAYLVGDLHLLTVVIWVSMRLLQAVDSHSGYEFPWSLNHFLPFWSGADHHDDHHKYFTGNFASSFRWWDYMLSTETASTVRKRADLKPVPDSKSK